MHDTSHFVRVSDHGLKGINFYWTRRDRFQMSEEELNSAGVFDEHAYVRKELITPLKSAATYFLSQGYELIIKDAHRSAKLYALIQNKRYALRGKSETDKLLNMVDMPHSNGLTIDVNLIDVSTGEEVHMRNPADDPDAFFIDFYRDKTDAISKQYQLLQDLLVNGMLDAGFTLGKKGEFWHFEYPL
jgi:D-alanyl-D-alanine dipeptidase